MSAGHVLSLAISAVCIRLLKLIRAVIVFIQSLKIWHFSFTNSCIHLKAMTLVIIYDHFHQCLSETNDF